MGGTTQILEIIGPVLAGVTFFLLLIVTNSNWSLVFYSVFSLGYVLAFFNFDLLKTNPNVALQLVSQIQKMYQY